MLYLKRIDIEIKQNIQSSLSNEITKEKKVRFYTTRLFEKTTPFRYDLILNF